VLEQGRGLEVQVVVREEMVWVMELVLGVEDMAHIVLGLALGSELGTLGQEHMEHTLGMGKVLGGGMEWALGKVYHRDTEWALGMVLACHKELGGDMEWALDMVLQLGLEEQGQNI
jgi:hypothetical protein